MTRDDKTGDAVDEWDKLDGDMSALDTDPRHIDPAGDLADAVESGGLDLSLADDLRELVDAAESGELGQVNPGIEAQVRIARALLADLADKDEQDADL